MMAEWTEGNVLLTLTPPLYLLYLWSRGNQSSNPPSNSLASHGLAAETTQSSLCPPSVVKAGGQGHLDSLSHSPHWALRSPKSRPLIKKVAGTRLCLIHLLFTHPLRWPKLTRAGWWGLMSKHSRPGPSAHTHLCSRLRAWDCLSPRSPKVCTKVLSCYSNQDNYVLLYKKTYTCIQRKSKCFPSTNI